MAEKIYTKGELAKKSPKELRDLAEKTHGLDTDGITTKGAIIELLLTLEVEEEIEEELEEEVEVEEEEELDEEIEADEVDEVEEEAPKTKKKAAKKKDEGEGTTLAAKQVASLLGTEPKTLRQFFRSPASTTQAVGSGGRYEFAEEDVPKIKTEFEAWKAGHGSRGAKRTGEGGSKRGKRGPKVAEVTEVEEVEELEIEELEDEELDDEELELEDEE